MRWTACLCVTALALVACGDDKDATPPVGQTVELEIDGIGTLTNRLSADAVPTTAV